ncbi:hypothetical protein COO60DRAFT_352228 [Scenedesmus sp. NREL 46B-D3]|nr:hypothetical protein COO60DRAFT_352228 [Scenedesmus sp. NREL 46B-D3]
MCERCISYIVALLCPAQAHSKRNLVSAADGHDSGERAQLVFEKVNQHSMACHHNAAVTMHSGVQHTQTPSTSAGWTRHDDGSEQTSALLLGVVLLLATTTRCSTAHGSSCHLALHTKLQGARLKRQQLLHRCASNFKTQEQPAAAAQMLASRRHRNKHANVSSWHFFSAYGA